MNNSDLAYKELLEKKIKTLQTDISNLEKRNKGIYLTNDITTEQIERKKLEISKIEEELKDYTEKIELGAVGTTIVGALDSIVENHDEKREAAQAKIAELQELKKKLTTKRAQRKIERQIDHQQKIINNLQKTDNVISGVQRVVMYPKYRKEMKKQQLLSQQEAKVAVAESSYNDIVEMQGMLQPNKNIFHKIQNEIYEIRKAKYIRKKDRAAEILNEMQKHDHPIIMRGAAPIVISKRLKTKFTNKLQQDQMMIDMSYNPNQSQNVIAATAK